MGAFHDKVHQQYGVEFDTKQWMDDAMVNCAYRGEQSVYQKWVDTCDEAVDWFLDELGAPISDYKLTFNAGEDTDFHFPGKMMHKIDTAPFYATKEMASCLCTAGGLQITDKSEVLDTNAQPIPGLYAIGNVSGTFGYNVAKTLAAL